MVALEAHTLHQRDVQIAQRRPVLLVYQVLALLDAELAAALISSRASIVALLFSLYEQAIQWPCTIGKPLEVCTHQLSL